MEIGFAIVDAFTSSPFAGNPAAVCRLAEAGATTWLAAVARELNQPATAFVVPEGDGFGLRWFSPQTELALCGHGTLASAHVLWEAGVVAGDEPVRFHSQSGPLVCLRRDGWIAMDFSAEPPRAVEAPPDLLRALGVAPRFVGRNRFDYLVELESAAAVRAAAPDLDLLRTVPTRGVILTALADTEEHDFVCRFFAPSAGVGEDAVTGSAQPCLGPFWGDRLGKTELTGYQASPRGGTVRVGLRGERVDVCGQAVTVARGVLGAPSHPGSPSPPGL
jgi:PhzF family phenazine biosynthesis protein